MSNTIASVLSLHLSVWNKEENALERVTHYVYNPVAIHSPAKAQLLEERDRETWRDWEWGQRKPPPPLPPFPPRTNRPVTSAVPVPQVTPATVAKRPKFRLYNAKMVPKKLSELLKNSDDIREMWLVFQRKKRKKPTQAQPLFGYF